MKKERVKTAKMRSTSSTKWLQRQLNDPFVMKAKQDGYRSRAAYKIIEIDEKFKIFKKGAKVVDLGAAPGGWSQIAVKKVGEDDENPNVLAVDILPMGSMFGVKVMTMDFLLDDSEQKIIDALGGVKADIVMSDMAANTTGNPKLDHLKIMTLLELAYDFAKKVMAFNGCFIAKIFQGGTETSLLDQIKKDFTTVKHFKPKSSRQESREYYVIAKGYKWKE